MAVKFGRNYVLKVLAQDPSQTNADLVTIEPPFTIEFDINRSQFSEARQATIRIYNLSANVRAKLRQDLTGPNKRQVFMQAGYGNNLSTILNGNVNQAWSVREGSNFITTIVAYEAGFASAQALIGISTPSGTNRISIINQMFNTLKQFDIAPGAIGDYSDTLTRGNAYSGNPLDILTELTGGGFFVDNGTAHALKDTEALDVPVLLINADTGLLNTPVREQQYFNFEMLFEPRMLIGQLLQIESQTDASFNGICRVNSIHHRGTISGAVCGEAVTSCSVLFGSYIKVPLVR